MGREIKINMKPSRKFDGMKYQVNYGVLLSEKFL